MDSFWSWVATLLFYQLPWWVQIVLLALVVGLPIYLLAVAIFGRELANRYMVHGVIVIVTLGLASKLRQDGRNQRIEEERRAEERAEQIVVEERQKSETLPDDELHKETDRWSKR